MKVLKDFDLKGKRVLVRCDFNVPLTAEGDILNDFRIKKTVPTIEYLIKKGAKVILMSHLGKPGGKVVENLKLDKVQEKLMEYLDLSVVKARDCVGKEIKDWIERMAPGEVLLLENLRFHKGEKENDPKFARALSELGNIFINEAFATCHRPHASIIGLPKYLPSGAGLLLEKEIKSLTRIIKKPERPLVAVVGGIKFETKIKLLDKLQELCEFELIGGKFTLEILKRKMEKYLSEEVILTKDVYVLEKNENLILRDIRDLKGDEFIPDIGPETIKIFSKRIMTAKTIFWNGPLGFIEKERFRTGTRKIAEKIIESGAYSVVGGGETIRVLSGLNLLHKFDHVCSGGGALVDFIVDEELVGVKALK
ncbi:phosphoglycerate kinase [Patescibacteria group bacterium]|nr:phosphoglycerate kinase [Patescibacteria group bacterium]